jgi:hypothetical protein
VIPDFFIVFGDNDGGSVIYETLSRNYRTVFCHYGFVIIHYGVFIVRSENVCHRYGVAFTNSATARGNFSAGIHRYTTFIADYASGSDDCCVAIDRFFVMSAPFFNAIFYN